jgi:hypothetical protein
LTTRRNVQKYQTQFEEEQFAEGTRDTHAEEPLTFDPAELINSTETLSSPSSASFTLAKVKHSERTLDP